MVDEQPLAILLHLPDLAMARDEATATLQAEAQKANAKGR